MSILIKKIRTENYEYRDSFELILDFENDRHHLLSISKTATRDEIVDKLSQLAYNLENDTNLD